MRRFTAVLVLFSVTFAGCDGQQAPPTTPSPRQPVSPETNPPPPPSGANPTNDPLVGRYSLTLDLGSECGRILDAARVRTYSATIDADRDARYVVTLGNASFLSGLICTFTVTGLGCNQFPATRNGDIIEFDLVNNNDDGHGGHIVEQLPSRTWIEVIGKATGELSADGIEATGSGSVWYCPSPSGYPFPCTSFTGCKSDEMRLTFRRN